MVVVKSCLLVFLDSKVKYALISAQRCMICQGDIARYREQASDTANYGKARRWVKEVTEILNFLTNVKYSSR